MWRGGGCLGLLSTQFLVLVLPYHEGSLWLAGLVVRTDKHSILIKVCSHFSTYFISFRFRVCTCSRQHFLHRNPYQRSRNLSSEKIYFFFFNLMASSCVVLDRQASCAIDHIAYESMKVLQRAEVRRGGVGDRFSLEAKRTVTVSNSRIAMET